MAIMILIVLYTLVGLIVSGQYIYADTYWWVREPKFTRILLGGVKGIALGIFWLPVYIAQEVLQFY